MTDAEKPLKGLAALLPERRREIASLGGKTSQSHGTAHKWTAETAREAAKKSVAARGSKQKENNQHEQ